MEKINRTLLHPNMGNAWQRPKTKDYLEILTAQALLCGARWDNGVGRHKEDIQGVTQRLMVPTVDAIWVRNKDPYWQPGIEESYDGGTYYWWIHVINYDAMVEYINEIGIPEAK